jgi:hypothetical protein
MVTVIASISSYRYILERRPHGYQDSVAPFPRKPERVKLPRRHEDSTIDRIPLPRLKSPWVFTSELSLQQIWPDQDIYLLAHKSSTPSVIGEQKGFHQRSCHRWFTKKGLRIWSSTEGEQWTNGITLIIRIKGTCSDHILSSIRSNMPVNCYSNFLY